MKVTDFLILGVVGAAIFYIAWKFFPPPGMSGDITQQDIDIANQDERDALSGAFQ